jgi:serine/threonine protein kinase
MDKALWTGKESLSLELKRRVDQICARFEDAWHANQGPRLEDFLADTSEPARSVLFRELLLLELTYRRSKADTLVPEEFRQRFPEYGALIDTIFHVPASAGLPRTEESQQDDQLPPEGNPMIPKLRGFEFIRCLGKGAFGEVWLATDLNLRKERAVKLLPRDRYTEGSIEMLLREARLMAQLPRHRNRVQVHSLSPGITNCFLVMEYVEGGSLKQQISPEAPMAWERAARYVADVADGLVEVHAQGILHRDIKPANIVWDRQRDEALLADFGIAAFSGQAQGLTGTPGYLAPELDGGTASPLSDVFSLAATFYCLVTGRPPFDPRDLLGGLRQARTGLSRPVAALSHVPRAIEEVILAGLEPDPRRRVDLATFTARLRGAHLQALADKLLELARRSAGKVNLHVSVSVANETDLVFRPVSLEAQPVEPTRNIDLVPEPAPAASVRTGDLVRFDVTVDADGYLTVLNLGSSGELKVVFPNPLVRDNRIRVGQTQRLTVKLTPPPGTDRAAVVWTRQPSALTPAEWRGRIEAGLVAAVPPQESTRGMDFVLHEAKEHTGDEWTAMVVTVSHQAP